MTNNDHLPAPPEWSAETMAELEQYAGAGLSQAPADNLVPLVYLLQKNSPQVDKHDQRCLDGAEAGDIWLRNAEPPVVKGTEGLLFQPCYFEIIWVEWIPRDRGGGFVARHATGPKPDVCPVADAVLQRDHANPQRIKWIRPNNNEVIMTRNHIGIVYNEGLEAAFVLPFSSTGHTISRDWMTKMNRRLLPSGQREPAWASIYRLRSRPRANAMGSWFTWVIDWWSYASDSQIRLGTDLHRAFLAGVGEADVAQLAAITHDPEVF